MRFLQGNLNRCRVAGDLLGQMVHEHMADLVIISEPYRCQPSQNWYPDLLTTAAIWVTGSIRVENHGSGEGYAWIRIKEKTVVSCYFSPNYTVSEFRQKLDALEDAIREKCNLIVAGDFNARAIEWGMPQTDTRGRLVLEMAARLNLTVLNRGSTPTYRRPGFGNSIPDITMISENLAPRANDWEVMEDYTGSDHNYISFRVVDGVEHHLEPNSLQTEWNVSKINKEVFLAFIDNNPVSSQAEFHETAASINAESLASSTMRLISGACAAAMPRKRHWVGRPPKYWWTAEIAELRRTALSLRRRSQRARTTERALALAAEHTRAKKALSKAIKASKARCWKELCDEVDGDPWGMGYKIVTRKLRVVGPENQLDADTKSRIVDALFPSHPVRVVEDAPVQNVVPPLFTEGELSAAVSSMKNKRAPGPDGVPVEALKLVASSQPFLLLSMFNTCLSAGVFPRQWKVARLALISKGKGPADSPSSYRPLCMLDTAGKLMERLLKPRLQEAIRVAGDLSKRQHGFRKGHSTIKAISEVIGAVSMAETACHQARPLVLLVTLDVKNAFNSARWSDMLWSLKHNFSVPEYLLAVIGDYLRDRLLIYQTNAGSREKEITAGAAQGSILGPDLWNASYDSLLRLEMPADVSLVGYADDVAVVITARSSEIAQLKLNQVMRRVSFWMKEHGLELAILKTEIVLLTKRRIPLVRPMTMGTEMVQTKEAIKYLGVTLDSRLTYWEHIRRVCEKAARVTISLSRLMANTSGPSMGKRKLLMATVHSTLLYGAEIWAGALRIKKYSKRMMAVQRRGALRIISSYRTVSEAAALVVAGVIPIDLLAAERKEVFARLTASNRTETSTVIRRQARVNAIREWQGRWSICDKGRWTARLIGDLDSWVCRPHGEVNFYLCQFLTGHGYFRAYLHRMGKVVAPICTLCNAERDDALHTFFHCPFFEEDRRFLISFVGGLSVDTVVPVMLRSKENWDAVGNFVEVVLRQKRDRGCLSASGELGVG